MGIVVQFLLLMVFLDKTWFGPVGKVLDERDAKIHACSSSVKTSGEELDTLQREAESILRDARVEAQKKINAAKKRTADTIDSELAAETSKLDAKLASTLRELELLSESAKDDIDKQVAKLTKLIIKRVLPSGFLI